MTIKNRLLVLFFATSLLCGEIVLGQEAIEKDIVLAQTLLYANDYNSKGLFWRHHKGAYILSGILGWGFPYTLPVLALWLPLHYIVQRSQGKLIAYRDSLLISPCGKSKPKRWKLHPFHWSDIENMELKYRKKKIKVKLTMEESFTRQHIDSSFYSVVYQFLLPKSDSLFVNYLQERFEDPWQMGDVGDRIEGELSRDSVIAGTQSPF